MTDFTSPHSTHRLTLVDSPGRLFILTVAALTMYLCHPCIVTLRYLSSSRQELDTMGNFGQFDIVPPAYGQAVGEEE